MTDAAFTDLLGLLFAWGFFILFILCGVAGFIARARPLEMPDIVKDLVHDDKIQIGYIDDGTPVNTVEVQVVDEDEVAKLKRQVEILKLKKQLESLKGECSSPQANHTKQLMLDCTGALVAMGERKTEAKRKTKDIFHRCPDIRTVEEFIKEAFVS